MWVQVPKKNDPPGAVIVVAAALELYATLRTYCDFLPEPVVKEMATFRAVVGEHVEVVP